MAGISYPLWYTLKNNMKTMLEAIATEEKAVDSGRDFQVQCNRWQPWIESQQNVALANIMISGVGPISERSASRTNNMDSVNCIVDMYAIGKAGGIIPADESAAKRLDLLIAQVREGLTRLDTNDFLFPKDPEYGNLIERNGAFALTYYDQEGERKSMQYAPARWSFDVYMPFIPEDKKVYLDLSALNIDVKKGDLDSFAALFDYS